jgi:hypothetical protein
MQNRIPASLYEIAWQYSLFDWLDAAESEAIDWDLAPEHLAYLTPRAKSGLFGADDSLITVYADLSDPDNPTLGSEGTDNGPVEFSVFTEQDRFKVGHSYPEGKTSSMTDYSITTHKGADAHHIAGLRDDAWWTNNIQDRFTDWAQSEYADQVREDASDEDAAILEGLAALGDDDDVMADLADAFLDLVGSEDDEIEALITVAVKLPGEDEYKLPGEVNVLNDVMRAKKADRLQNISVEDASGEATGYVTGEDQTVTGGSPGLFGMYGKKQREHFHDLDTDGSSAWRSRPLSFDVAAAVAVAGSLFDDFFRGLGSSRRLYVLPYLAARRDDIDPVTFRWFRDEVYNRIQSAEGGSDGNFDAELEDVIRQTRQSEADSSGEAESEALFGESDPSAWDRVRIAIVHQVTGNPDRVFFDTLDGLSRAAELEDVHNRVTKSTVFSNDGIFVDNPSPESSPLLGRELPLTRYILYGGYFQRTTEPTRSSRSASDTPGAGDADDSRMEPVRTLLTDGRLDSSGLLERYVHQLVQDQRQQFDGESQYIAFPKRSVVEQYVQLRALSDAEAIDTTDTVSFITTAMADTFDTQDDRLEQFIKSHEVLNNDPEQAVFLLGGLIGRISAYQSYEGIASTLIRRYPVDYLTKQTVKEVTKEIMQMNNSYAEADDNRSYWTNSRYTDKLPNLMLSANPSSWSLTEAELQWVYSLGIAYGLSDSSLEEQDDEETDAEATN